MDYSFPGKLEYILDKNIEHDFFVQTSTPLFDECSSEQEDILKVNKLIHKNISPYFENITDVLLLTYLSPEIQKLSFL